MSPDGGANPRICRHRAGCGSWQNPLAPGCRGVYSEEIICRLFVEKPRKFILFYLNLSNFPEIQSSANAPSRPAIIGGIFLQPLTANAGNCARRTLPGNSIPTDQGRIEANGAEGNATPRGGQSYGAPTSQDTSSRFISRTANAGKFGSRFVDKSMSCGMMAGFDASDCFRRNEAHDG